MKRMIGKTAVSVEDFRETLLFRFDDGSAAEFYHQQDCCEGVRIEDVCGDLADLCGSPLVLAECISNEIKDVLDGDERWTFYRFATVKGTVTVRWLGQSNGFYSTEVDFRWIEGKR